VRPCQFHLELLLLQHMQAGHAATRTLQEQPGSHPEWNGETRLEELNDLFFSRDSLSYSDCTDRSLNWVRWECRLNQLGLQTLQHSLHPES
jgi:hypothetical protein